MTRYILCFLLSAIIQHNALAQESKATAPKCPSRLVSFGAPMLEIASIQGQTLLSVGGMGAVVINKRLVFGGFGQTGTTTVVLSDNRSYRTSASQGGVMAGYMLGYYRSIHLLTGLRLGWSTHTFDAIGSHQPFEQSSVNVTPYAGLEMNVTHFLRIQLLSGYRLALNSKLPQSTAPLPIDLNSAIGILALSFGHF